MCGWRGSAQQHPSACSALTCQLSVRPQGPLPICREGPGHPVGPACTGSRILHGSHPGVGIQHPESEDVRPLSQRNQRV